MKGGLEMTAYGLENGRDRSRDENQGRPFSEKAPQKGSMILEAIIVLGMVATFTPLLYKHVADRRADIENINRANTLIFLQQRTEEYLKDPDNVAALVEELGHNQHKEIYPSELGIGNNFDGRYIIGIRREDENNQPVLKAMIIDTVNTGSDLRAAKVAELIGISAGIYTAVDPDAAWGINGMWSEPLSRYFTTTNIPTGAVAVTTEYNKEKYRVSMSDIVVDSDLDLGEFELTAAQINAINLAAQNGTVGELTATNKVTAPKVVATGYLCVGGEEEENCIDTFEGVGQKSSISLIQECNAGILDSCKEAYLRGINKSCSDVESMYYQFATTPPDPKIYTLTYGNGEVYWGEVRVRCEGTSFVVNGISTPNLTSPVEKVGDTAFGITQPGWYQVILKGEEGVEGGNSRGAGGILIASTYYDADTLITIKGIKGGMDTSDSFGGAGVGLWDNGHAASGSPKLVAGGGAGLGGGGYVGGSGNTNQYWGYGWNENKGENTSCCLNACITGAEGGCFFYTSDPYYLGGSGTGASGYSCPTGYTCRAITGGASLLAGSEANSTYPARIYGNWSDSSHSDALGYASITYCGTSQSDCTPTCAVDDDCSGATPDCNNGFCAAPKSCVTSADCTVPHRSFCKNGACVNMTGTEIFYVSGASFSIDQHGKAWAMPVSRGSVGVQGKVKIVVQGGQGSSTPSNVRNAAGGIIKATKYFPDITDLEIKAIAGWKSSWSAGMFIYENGILVVGAGGGGETKGGGGILGGNGSCSKTSYGATSCSTGFSASQVFTSGWYHGSGGNSTPSSASVLNAQGGANAWNASLTLYGGTGSSAEDCAAAGYDCYFIQPGGNSTDYYQFHPDDPYYPAASYGNLGPCSVSITYCGPYADSPCPAD